MVSTKGRRYYRMPSKWPFYNAPDVILMSPTAVSEIVHNDNAWPLVVQKCWKNYVKTTLELTKLTYKLTV